MYFFFRNFILSRPAAMLCSSPTHPVSIKEEEGEEGALHIDKGNFLFPFTLSTPFYFVLGFLRVLLPSPRSSFSSSIFPLSSSNEAAPPRYCSLTMCNLYSMLLCPPVSFATQFSLTNYRKPSQLSPWGHRQTKNELPQRGWFAKDEKEGVKVNIEGTGKRECA